LDIYSPTNGSNNIANRKRKYTNTHVKKLTADAYLRNIAQGYLLLLLFPIYRVAPKSKPLLRLIIKSY